MRQRILLQDVRCVLFSVHGKLRLIIYRCRRGRRELYLAASTSSGLRCCASRVRPVLYISGRLADVYDRVGIIHLDEIDKLARRGAGDGLATWGGGRDVGGEGVQQAFLRLLEGTTVTLSAKPPPISSGGSGSSSHSGSNSSSFGQGKDGLDTWDAGPMKSGFGAQPPPGISPKKGVRDGLPGFGGGSSSGT
jgi:hypothetical protein